VLDVAFARAVRIGDELAVVDPIVTVRVAHEPQVRWLAHEQTALDCLDGARQDQLVGEDRAL
jgi:hypothetical protein